LSYDGAQYSLAGYSDSGYDNFVAQGQNLSIAPGRYLSVRMLASAETGSVAGSVTASYTDGSTTARDVLVPPWWNWVYPSGGDIVMPFYYTNETTDYNRSNIFQTVSWLDSTKDLTSLHMPISKASNRLHIFAVTLWPAPLSNLSTGPELEVQYARSTRKWMGSTAATQTFEVTVSNVGEQGWVLANDSVEVSIESDGVTTVKPGIIKRLRPGDQVTVQVGVENKDGVESGTIGNATARLKSDTVDVTHDFEATFGVGAYEPTYTSIYSHESPDWYNGAKFGIFIHWGVYSIPAWVGSHEGLDGLAERRSADIDNGGKCRI
jgi:alpha-L-fucosidase